MKRQAESRNYRRPLHLPPVFHRHGRRGVVVVHLHVDVDRARFLLRADEVRKVRRIVRGDKPQQVFQARLLREPPMIGRESRRDAVETGGRNDVNLALQRPLARWRWMVNERPEIGDVGDFGHEQIIV